MTPLARSSLIIAALLIVRASSPAAAGSPAPAPAKKLIEFGWDEPDPSFMRRHLAQLEATPFDGCVYHLLYANPGRPPGSFTWEAWGRRAFTEAEVDSGLRDLEATRFRRFRWNFLRLNVTPGDLDWFDDYGAVVSNARLAASVARRGHSAGVILDTEPYQNEIFRYASQRDTATRSFEEYAAQAGRRGAEVMRAFEQGYPGLTVFLTYGPVGPYLQSLAGVSRETGRYGLLTPFVDGMVSAASDSATIVDGNEGSYPERDPRKLDPYIEAMTAGVVSWVSDSTRYRRVVSRSFGFWMDHDWRHRPWDTGDPTKSYRTPDQLRAVVRRALELADEYVWVYSEKARWWTESGRRQDLPEAYVRALWDARKGLAP